MTHVENEIIIYERIYSSEGNEQYVSRLLYADIPVITHGVGVSYFLFEYRDGTPLQNYLSHASFSKEEAICIVQHMTSILGFLHSIGILHRDIKPNNMFLPKGSLKPIVFDFGVSCFSDDSTSSEFVGSREYAHPDALFAFSKTCSLYNFSTKYDTYSVKTIAVHDILPCVRTQDRETFLAWLHQQIPEEVGKTGDRPGLIPEPCVE
jgi:serine/threonine protein kinase